MERFALYLPRLEKGGGGGMYVLYDLFGIFLKIYYSYCIIIVNVLMLNGKLLLVIVKFL